MPDQNLRQNPRQNLRQKVLVAWLGDSSLDSPIVAWSLWDGTGERDTMAGDTDKAPYRTGLDALRDGWRLIQMSPLLPHYPGTETQTAYLKYEFVFEQIVAVAATNGGAQ